MKKIAIIGAGIAGLTALQALKQQDCSVTVFDKSRGSGGRLSSKKSGASSWDMGAQFMRAHTKEFKAQLKAWETDGWIAHWDVTPPSINGTQKRPRQMMSTAMSACLHDGLSQLLESADDFITQTRIVESRFTSDQLKWSLVAEDGSEFDRSMSSLSTRHHNRPCHSCQQNHRSLSR